MKNNNADIWGLAVYRPLKYKSSVMKVRQLSGSHDPRQAHLAFSTFPLPSGLVTSGIGPCAGGGILEPDSLRIKILVLPLSSCITVGELFTFSVPQFPH